MHSMHDEWLRHSPTVGRGFSLFCLQWQVALQQALQLGHGTENKIHNPFQSDDKMRWIPGYPHVPHKSTKRFRDQPVAHDQPGLIVRDRLIPKSFCRFVGNMGVARNPSHFVVRLEWIMYLVLRSVSQLQSLLQRNLPLQAKQAKPTPNSRGVAQPFVMHRVHD